MKTSDNDISDRVPSVCPLSSHQSSFSSVFNFLLTSVAQSLQAVHFHSVSSWSPRKEVIFPKAHQLQADEKPPFPFPAPLKHMVMVVWGLAHFCHLPAVWPWANALASLSLSFLICKVKIMHSLWGYLKIKLNDYMEELSTGFGTNNVGCNTREFPSSSLHQGRT